MSGVWRLPAAGGGRQLGASFPVVVAVVAVFVAVAIAAWPLYVQASARVKMQVLHSDVRSWTDRVLFVSRQDGTYPPAVELAGILASDPALLETPNVVTVWPDCRLVDDSGAVTPARGEYVVVGVVDVSGMVGERVTPVVFDSVSGDFRETAAAPSGETGCSVSAGGSGAVVAVAVGGGQPPQITAR